MKYTNKHNLPTALYAALVRDDYQQRGDISITGLIKSPRMFQLEKRHDHEIEVDASQNLWMLLGSAVHYILEKGDDKNALQEEPLSIQVNGWTVSGKPDMWKDEAVTDWKCTSVWAMKFDKKEWEEQTNLYGYLYEKIGFPVKNLYICAILRDWVHSELLRYKDYPPIPFVKKEIKKISQDNARKLITSRVSLHQSSEGLSDSALGECTPEEKWARPSKWAVKKKGNKNAAKGGVHDSEEKAQGFISEKIVADKTIGNQLYIEERIGDQWLKCRNFCSAKNYCNLFQNQLKKEIKDARDTD